MIVGGHNCFCRPPPVPPWFPRRYQISSSDSFSLLLFGSFFCSTAPQAFFRPDHSFRGRRAQGLSRLAQPPEGLGLDSPEHGGTLDGSGCSIGPAERSLNFSLRSHSFVQTCGESERRAQGRQGWCHPSGSLALHHNHVVCFNFAVTFPGLKNRDFNQLPVSPPGKQQ